MKSLRQTERETLRVLRDAVAEAAEKHRRMGVPMAVWKDGKVALITPARARRTKETTRKG